MDSGQITPNASDREYRKKRVEELGSALAQIRARVKANRGSGGKKDEEVVQSGGSKPAEDTERTAMTKKILEEDRARFTKLQQNRVKMKETMDQILIEREEQKKVEKQLQEAIAKVTAPTPELPPLIRQRIIDLETTVENLKERLSEKDKVLSSKTQALTVLHSQLMQRSQEQVEKAMAFTQEISAIKDDFGKREDLLKKEIERLKEREEELECRLSDKEMSSLEFQNLQSELDGVRKELSESTSKNEETSKQLESVNKINLKLKAQLKALKIERDKMRQSLEGVEDIEALRNRIALLEEEKESFEESKSKVTSLQGELDQIRQDFKHLEEEKVVLQENLDGARTQIQDQENLLQEVKNSLKTMEEQKISAEMRSIELEEKLEEVQAKTSGQIEQLLGEISALGNQINERNSVIDSLSEQLRLKDQEISDIKGNNFPAVIDSDTTRLKEIESYNAELMEKVREFQLKSEENQRAADHLNTLVTEKNETINKLRIKNDELQLVVTDLNNNKVMLENEIRKLKANEEQVKTDKPPQAAQNIQDVKEDSDLTRKFKKLAANYKIKVKLCQELEEKCKTLESVLEEKTKLVSNLTVEKESLQSELDALKLQEESLRGDLAEFKAKNEQLLKLLEDISPKLEAMEVERSSALLKADKMNKAFEELKEWKEGDSKLLQEHVSSVNTMANNVSLLEEELAKLQSIVSEKNSVIGEMESERKKLVEDMRNSELELERLRGLYQQESVKNQNVLTNLQSLESEMLRSREEMNQIAEQLDNVTKNYNSCLKNLQERESYIDALEQDIVIMKTKMYNLEAGISDRHRILEERGNLLSARLEEAEIITKTFNKCQADMDKKFKMMEDNENAMKVNLSKLQNEIESLNKINSELKLKNETSEKKIAELTEENTTLVEIRNSYNATLDRIEILNGQLKEVMCDFEAKNQEIERLGEERADIFNKLTDLEDAYSDLKGQLDESEEQCMKLQAELDDKGLKFENALKEMKSLQDEIVHLKAVSNQEQKKDIVDEVKSTDIQMFSWDQHSHSEIVGPTSKTEGDSALLQEKVRMLEEANKEIENLRFHISYVSAQKDAEIESLKEELEEINNILESKRSANQNDENRPNNIPVLAWDSFSTNTGDQQNIQGELEMYKNKLVVANREIEALKDSLARLSVSSYEDYDLNASIEKQNILQDALKQCKTQFDSAHQEINELKKTLAATVAQNECEISRLNAELERTLAEKCELEKSLALYSKAQPDNEEVKMFSWNQATDRDEDDGLTSQLIQKTESLQAAQQEIANLQASLSSVLSEKDTEVTALKCEIARLANEKECIEKALNESRGASSETRQDDVRMFSWGQQNPDGVKDEEDGWGWIGAEAHLEQDHKHSELQIQTLTQKVKELEEERLNLNEKLNASKIKCVKLIKKLKEMEIVYEQSKTQRNVGFGDLDLALQEELRSQLDNLEIKNKELTAELNNIKLERDNLNKKVDVLVSANEQLIEMKERQDIEVQMWQKRSAELKNEVQGLQWSLEELKTETPASGRGGDELSDKLNALAVENEELQRIICNLKDGRPLGSPDIAAELSSLKDELKRLKDVRLKEKESFENELKKANEELDAMEQQFDSLSKENQSLKEQVAETEKMKHDLNSLKQQVTELNTQNSQLREALGSYENALDSDLKQKLQILSNENNVLKNEIARLNGINAELHQQLAQAERVKQEVSSLLHKTEKLELENADLKEQLTQYQSVNQELSSKRDKVKELNREIEFLNVDIEMCQEEYDTITKLIAQTQSSNSNLKEKIAQLLSLNPNLTSETDLVEKLNLQFESLNADLEMFKEEYYNVANKLIQAQTSNSALKKKLAQLQTSKSDLEERQTRLQFSDQDLAGKKYHVEQLNRQINFLNADLDMCREEYETITKMIAKSQSSNSDLKEKLAQLLSLNPNVTSDTDLLVQLHLQFESLNADLEMFKEEYYNVANKLAQSQSSNLALKENLAQLQSSNSNLQEKLAQSQSPNQDLISKKDQIEELNRQIEFLNVDLEMCKEEYDTITKVIGQSQSSNLNLKEQLAQLLSLNPDLTSERDLIEKLNLRLETLNADLDTFKEEYDNVTKRLTESQNSNSILREQLSQLQSSNPDLSNEKNQVEELKSQIKSLSTELDSLKAEYQRVKGTNQMYIERVENDVKNLENNLRSAQSNLKEFEDFFEDLCDALAFINSNTRKDMFKLILDEIVSLMSSKWNESKNVQLNLSSPAEENIQSSSVQLGSTPPVFKGFSAFPSDAFDNFNLNQNNPAVETLKAEIEKLKSLVQKYEKDFSKLNCEKNSCECTIEELKTEIGLVNSQYEKLKVAHSNEVMDAIARFDQARSEIEKWKSEANKLRNEITHLVEKHSREIEGLKRNDLGSKQKVSEIEENLQNTLLNKDQENRNLSIILSEKEQLLANAINEKNALQTQYETVSQQFYSLENRLRELTRENEELQGDLNRARTDNNTFIEKQNDEIQELRARLEYLSQTQNIKNAESQNELVLKQQVKDLSDKLSNLESVNANMQLKIAGQTEEISKLQQNIADLGNNRHYLENLITDKQKELDLINEQIKSQNGLGSKEQNVEQLVALIKEKDLEIARVSKVLLDTQERLVQIQDSKSIDKILSLQNKLDHALYTIHERDVRIDELTQEIIQLLGERDSLQLRLSEALREIEVIRRGTATSSSTSSPELQHKLGELHGGYKKDPAVQLDMENRHNQQMNLYSDKEQSVDYGIFNWFFSSPTPSSQQQ